MNILLCLLIKPLPYTHTNTHTCVHAHTTQLTGTRDPESPVCHIFITGRAGLQVDVVKLFTGSFCWLWCCCKAGNLFWEIATGICALLKLSCKMASLAQRPQTDHNAQPRRSRAGPPSAAKNVQTQHKARSHLDTLPHFLLLIKL